MPPLEPSAPDASDAEMLSASTEDADVRRHVLLSVYDVLVSFLRGYVTHHDPLSPFMAHTFLLGQYPTQDNRGRLARTPRITGVG